MKILIPDNNPTEKINIPFNNKEYSKKEIKNIEKNKKIMKGHLLGFILNLFR